MVNFSYLLLVSLELSHEFLVFFNQGYHLQPFLYHLFFISPDSLRQALVLESHLGLFLILLQFVSLHLLQLI